MRRIGGDTTKNTTVIVNPGGDGGGGGGGDGHTHSQYVPVVGGVTLTGNIGAAAGVTIDGVDISAHASNADAHHAAVTVSNTGLSLERAGGWLARVICGRSVYRRRRRGYETRRAQRVDQDN